MERKDRYYQEWGKEAQELHPGSVVVIPAEVKHWHEAVEQVNTFGYILRNQLELL